MPIYEYKCPKCGLGLELLQKTDDPGPLCFCGEGDPVSMDKLMSKNSFQLKGKGWYKTDYKAKEDK